MDLKKLSILPAIAVVATLAAVPHTGWLVRMQLKTVFGGGVASLGNLGGSTRGDAARQAVAASPANFDLAFAQAIEASGSERLAALRRVAERFPDRPEAPAAFLRLAMHDGFHFGRDEEQWALDDKKAPAKRVREITDPALLADIDAVAARGEEIDPDNAYFPTLRAVGLLAAHRDDDARAALSRAARAPRWDEHLPAEVHARASLATAVQGEIGMVAHMAQSASMLFPHLAQIRGLSRVMLWRAIQREKAGKTDAGIAIRNDLLAVSRTMRDQSTTLIGNLVGSAVNAIARSRPGGAPKVKRAAGNRTDAEVREQARQQQLAYADWAAAHGDTGARAAAEADLATSLAIKDISHRGLERGIYNLKALGITAAGQMGGIVVLANALWMVLLGGLAILAARVTPIGRGGKLPVSQFLIGSVVVWIVLCLCAAFVGGSTKTGLEGILPMLSSQGVSEESNPTAAVALLCGAVSLAAPLLTWTILLIRAALARKTSFSRTVVLGMRGAALPVATFLLVAYAASVVWAAGRDAAGRAELERSIRHEGRYYAQLLGERWPGDR